MAHLVQFPPVVVLSFSTLLIPENFVVFCVFPKSFVFQQSEAQFM